MPQIANENSSLFAKSPTHRGLDASIICGSAGDHQDGNPETRHKSDPHQKLLTVHRLVDGQTWTAFAIASQLASSTEPPVH